MGKSEDIEPSVKARIEANIREKIAELRLSKRQFALQAGIDPPSLVKILNGTRTAGLSVLLKLRRKWGMDLNRMVDVDPPREFFKDDPVRTPQVRVVGRKT